MVSDSTKCRDRVAWMSESCADFLGQVGSFASGSRLSMATMGGKKERGIVGGRSRDTYGRVDGAQGECGGVV